MTSKSNSERRQWSLAEKRRIATEALQPGTNKAALARRYRISDSQLYAWRKLLRDEADTRFQPVITEEMSPNKDDEDSGLIDIVLSNGHRLTVSGAVDPAYVERLLRALALA